MIDFTAAAVVVGLAGWWLWRKFTAPPACTRCHSATVGPAPRIAAHQLSIGRSSTARAAASDSAADPPRS